MQAIQRVPGSHSLLKIAPAPVRDNSMPKGLRSALWPSIALSALAGVVALSPVWNNAARTWTTDPLRSMGAAFPVLALAGVVVAWRRLGWTLDGRWWALLPLAVSFWMACWAPLSMFVMGHGGKTGLQRLGVTPFLFGVGLTLLFGGPHLLRRSLAPLCLLLCINPVPRSFNGLIDLPLQQLSAGTARAFAHLLGLQPTGDQLRMMFTPSFGMMIVPGCNGVRGALAMAYLVLIGGYCLHLRLRTLPPLAAGALLFGYALNLLRLCSLVVYYRIGLEWPAIQRYVTGIDYAIGCTIFLSASVALGLVLQSMRPNNPSDRTPLAMPTIHSVHGARCTMARALALLLLAVAFLPAQTRSAAPAATIVTDPGPIATAFPERAGDYRLIRTSFERDYSGKILFVLADYETNGSRKPLTLGLWLGWEGHMVRLSKMVRGIYPTSTGFFDATGRGSMPLHFVTFAYDEGGVRDLDAETTCTEAGCSNRIAGTGLESLTLIVPRIERTAFLGNEKSLAILVRRTSIETGQSSAQDPRPAFADDVRSFTGEIDFTAMVRRFGSAP
jgi:exosortase J